MAASKNPSVVSKTAEKKIWERHVEYEMVLLCTKKLTSNLGTKTVEQQRSIRDKLLRKKYIGV